MSTGRTFLLSIAMVSILSGCIATGGTSQPPTKSAIGAETVAITSRQCKRFYIYMDGSGSLDSDQCQVVTAEVVDQLRLHPRAVCGVNAVRFADASSFSPPSEFVWNDAPSSREFSPDMSKATDQERMFTDPQNDFIARQKAEFDDQTEQTEKAYKQIVDGKTEELKTFLLKKPHAAQCTSLPNLSKRLAREKPPVALVITDGLFGCPMHGKSDVVSDVLVTEGKIVFVLVKNNGASIDNEQTFDERAKAIKVSFPNSEIFAAYMIKEAMQEALK